MKIHLIGICGTGMGSLAGLLKAAGHDVRGSDSDVYPPMSTQLAEQSSIQIACAGWELRKVLAQLVLHTI